MDQITEISPEECFDGETMFPEAWEYSSDFNSIYLNSTPNRSTLECIRHIKLSAISQNFDKK